jgi:hypothetical protein
MASKFGGIPLAGTGGSKFGGVPIQQPSPIQTISPRAVSTVSLAQQQQPERTFGEAVIGGLETAATIGTGAIAEPLAGLAGIRAGLDPSAPPGTAARAVESTREALTFTPRTQAGKEILADVGEVIAPIGEAFEGLENKLGETAFDLTGSPALATAAAIIPTAVVEALGVGAGKGAVKQAAKIKKSLAKGKIARAINDAAPTIDQLKDTARNIYREIDDIGAVVKPEAYSSLSQKLRSEAQKAGLDPDITPKSTKVLKRFEELEGKPVSITEIDTLRKVAQTAASAIEPAEKALGVRIINTIDDFLDNAGVTIFETPGKDLAIGKRYKVARDLWGRARKAETVQEAFEKARLQASGFENGIRTQFRAILNNKKKSKFFNAEEKAAMKRVVMGDTKENIARLVGKLGFSEGGATQLIGTSIGVGAGAAVGGVPGAVIVPLVGQLSKKLAQRMTIKNADFADQVIRAGKDAKKITAAYLKNTAKAERSAAELSELLMRNDIDLSLLPDTELTISARQIALENRAALAGALAAEAPPEQP